MSFHFKTSTFARLQQLIDNSAGYKTITPRIFKHSEKKSNSCVGETYRVNKPESNLHEVT